MKPCVSWKAAERAGWSARCFLQHRRGSRKDADDLWASLERVRPILVWCRCLRFVHLGDPFEPCRRACCAFRIASRCRSRHRPDAPYFRSNRALGCTGSPPRRHLVVAGTCHSGASVCSRRRVIITFCHRSEIGHQRCGCRAGPSRSIGVRVAVSLAATANGLHLARAWGRRAKPRNAQWRALRWLRRPSPDLRTSG